VHVVKWSVVIFDARHPPNEGMLLLPYLTERPGLKTRHLVWRPEVCMDGVRVSKDCRLYVSSEAAWLEVGERPGPSSNQSRAEVACCFEYYACA